MTPTHARSPRALCALVAVTALLSGAAACSSGGDDQHGAPPAHSHSDEDYHGTPGLPDAHGPTGVLTTALGQMFSWEPVTDAGPTDALIRTKPMLAGAALASANAPAHPQVRMSAEWASWRASSDLVTARVDSAQATTITPDKAMGRATVTQTVLHLDGGSTPYQRFTVTTQLVHTSGGWKLATYPDITTTTTG